MASDTKTRVAQEDKKCCGCATYNNKKSGFLKSTLKLVGVYVGFIAAISLASSALNTLERIGYAINKSQVVAHIPIKGNITREYCDEIISQIDKARGIGSKVFVFEINSPGGYVLPSKELSEKINELEAGADEKKGTLDDIKTIAYIKDTSASGAYWIASAADYIVADEASMVGSIGVRGGFFDFSGLMEKWGISYHEFKSGNKKTIGSPFRPPTENEKKEIEAQINLLHKMFIGAVAENRKVPYEKIEQIADGGVFYGDEAKQLGLVDVIGGRREIDEILTKQIGLDKNRVVLKRYERPKGFLESFFGQ